MRVPLQTIIMTSDKGMKLLGGFFYLWNKYTKDWHNDTIVCGFTSPEIWPLEYHGSRFYSIGNFEDYPPDKWSDAFIHVLDNVADEVFFLTFDDFWVIRPVNLHALSMMNDYMYQFQNVLKFDPTTDRLHSSGVKSYGNLSYLDLVKSDPASEYHMSLWGGIWRRDLLKKIIIPGERAQEIEINGTPRLREYGDEMLVLGTRQAPLLHANVVQNGTWNNRESGLGTLLESDKEELKELGYL